MKIKVNIPLEVEISDANQELINSKINKAVIELVQDKEKFTKIIEPLVFESLQENMIHFDIYDSEENIAAVDEAIKPLVKKWVDENGESLTESIGKSIKDGMENTLSDIVNGL